VRRLDFLIGSFSGFFVRQNFFTGQRSHFGLCGKQTSAPKSISAELKRAALRFGTSRVAFFHSFSRPIVESIEPRMLNSRASTRELFASTIGTGLLKAKVATAFAVHRPTPGSLRIAAMSRGKTPPYRACMIFAAAWRFRARL